MSKHKALTGAIAALASVATLGALAAPALAADTTYSPNGKPVSELAKHGGAQRIATIGSQQLQARVVTPYYGLNLDSISQNTVLLGSN